MRFVPFAAVMLLLLGSVHFYLARKLWQCVRRTPPFILFAVLMTVLMASLILGFVFSSQAVKAVGFYWMGAMIYLLLFFLLGDVVLLGARLLRLHPAAVTVHRAALLLAAITVIGGAYHAAQLQTVRYDAALTAHPALPETKIALLSDVHLGALGSEKRLEKIVAAVNAEQPDLVCIAGDLFDNNFAAIRDPDRALALLKQLSAPMGVYACTGNHDAGATWQQMESFIAGCGIQLLKDEAVVIGDQLVLAGRLDPSPIGKQGDSRRGPLNVILSGTPADLPVMVMDHNPGSLAEYGPETDLLLCGHTHRGQIFPGSLFTRRLYEVDYGYRPAGAVSPHVVVSSGAGTWGMPMRVGTDCEVVIIRLNP